MRLAALATVAIVFAGCSSSSSHAGPAPPDTVAPSSAVTRPVTSTTRTTPTTVAVTRPSTTGISSPPASIPANCSTDATPALQRWIDAVRDKSTLLFPSRACYRIEEPLIIKNRNGLVIEGRGTTLRATTVGNRTRSQLELQAVTNVVVRDLVVRGANPTAGATRAAYHKELEAQHAFQLSGVTNVLLDHVQAYDLYGDFVYIGGFSDQPSRNVRVTNSTFERSGRQGISITDADGVTIASNRIGGVARSLFDIEPNVAKQEARAIRITDNVTGAAKNFWLADKGAPANIGDIQVTGNRMTDSTGGLVFVYAPSGPYRGPFLFSSNQFVATGRVGDEGSKGGFFIAHAANVTIRDNRVVFPKGKNMPAVEIRDSHTVSVSGNRFTNAGQMLLATQGSSDYHVR